MSRVPKNIVVVFDEAYFEFLDDPPDTLQYVREGRNVVVLAHVFENSWTGWSADRLWRRDRGFGRGPSQDEAAIQCEQHRASRRARGAGGRRAPARDEARDRRRPRLFAGTILRIEGSLCASHREFRDGKRGRWLCALRETAATQIIVRPLKGYGLPEWVRITVGAMEENKKLIAALREVMCA